MGIFDFLFNKTGQTPAFNPEQPGFYDPTEEERKQARKMALIQAGAGMLMNNRGNYGAFAPALGAGIAQGLQGYQQGLQEGPDRRMKQLQQQLYAQQVGSQVAGKKKELEEDQAADNQARFMFTAMGINPDDLENEIKGGFMKVSNTPQPITASPVPYVGEGEIPLTTAAGQDLSFVPPPPQKINKVDNLLTKWGYSPEEKDYFYSMAQNDPASAAKTLREEMKARRMAIIRGKKEAQIKPFEGLDTDTKTALWAAGITDPNDPRLSDEGFRRKLIREGDTSRAARATKFQGPFTEGEKGFKHELSLRSDFRQEPIYKAYQQVESAYRQIVTSLDKVSPAGDMAAATKIMKLLDPESVVRESELAMAMQATGLLDRITSYADRTLKGEKLTPSQREDFRGLADRLFDQAAESYNSKHAEYEKLAGDYGFDSARAFGPRASKPKVIFGGQKAIVTQPASPSGWKIERVK